MSKVSTHCLTANAQCDVYLVRQYNPRNSFRIPEQLVNVVITNNLIMVLLSSHILAVNQFVALVTDEAIKRFENCAKILALRNRVQTILTFG